MVWCRSVAPDRSPLQANELNVKSEHGLLFQDMDNSGAYRVMYTLTVSGTYDASVVLGATGIVNRFYLNLITDSRSSIVIM